MSGGCGPATRLVIICCVWVLFGHHFAAIAGAGPLVGTTLAPFLFILLVTLAGLGVVVVKALADSPWGLFTIVWKVRLRSTWRRSSKGLPGMRTQPGY